MTNSPFFFKKREKKILNPSTFGKLTICSSNYLFFEVNTTTSEDYYKDVKKMRIIQKYKNIDPIERITKYQCVKPNVKNHKKALFKNILTNFKTNESLFLTLTYSSNCYDSKLLSNRLSYFFKKLRKACNESIVYIYIPEKQRNKRKELNQYVMHYHILIKFESNNNPFIKKEVLKEAWPYGSISIKRVWDIYGLARYLCNYYNQNTLKFVLKKEQQSGLHPFSRRYQPSRNCERPITSFCTISEFYKYILNQNYLKIREYGVSFYRRGFLHKNILLNHYREMIFRRI